MLRPLLWKLNDIKDVLQIEDLVDEMLAILSDRNAIIQKKEMEHAQAVINEIYRNGL